MMAFIIGGGPQINVSRSLASGTSRLMVSALSIPFSPVHVGAFATNHSIRILVFSALFGWDWFCLLNQIWENV